MCAGGAWSAGAANVGAGARTATSDLENLNLAREMLVPRLSFGNTMECNSGGIEGAVVIATAGSTSALDA